MELSKIEWTDHTFSPWHGCAKVSAGCKNCYADAQHSFHYSSLKSQQGTCWGISAPRLAVSTDTWKKPLKWNREAQAAGIRARVFCASMADVFEAQSPLSAAFAGQTAEVPRGGGKTRTVTFVDIATERLRLLRLIYDTPHLDWLLLTKRPENIVPAVKAAFWQETQTGSDLKFSVWLHLWLTGKAPANVWLGTSVENQEQADARIPHLLAAPAAVRFLSCEPLLSAVDVSAYLMSADGFAPTPDGPVHREDGGVGVDWVIVGGESGHGARPMHPDWARGLRDQCQAAGVSFFFKQWGEWAPAAEWSYGVLPHNQVALLPDGTPVSNDDNPDEVGGQRLLKVGKHAAGRLLDGREWNEMPQRKEVGRER